MTRTERLTVSPAESRMRLDRLLALRFPDRSRSYLQKLIRDGQVSVAGSEAPLRAGRPMAEGERVEVSFPPPEPSALVPEQRPLAVLHEDEDLLVLDKPAGVTVHPGAGARTGTLVHALLHHCRDLSGIGGVERPGIVHRLDKDTTGVLLVAKNDAAHRELSRQFAAREVSKVYLALVWGRPRAARGVVDAPIGRDRVRRMIISTRTSAPRDAITEYTVLEALPGHSWLEARPKTGRTHQIRVHLRELGHPIVGDPLYGGARAAQERDPGRREALRIFGRLALHAWRITFQHPRTRASRTFEAPVPADLAALREALR